VKPKVDEYRAVDPEAPASIRSARRSPVHLPLRSSDRHRISANLRPNPATRLDSQRAVHPVVSGNGAGWDRRASGHRPTGRCV